MIRGPRRSGRDITLHDLADLERAVELAGNVRLVVIDPLWAFFGAERPTRHQGLPGDNRSGGPGRPARKYWPWWSPAELGGPRRPGVQGPA